MTRLSIPRAAILAAAALPVLAMPVGAFAQTAAAPTPAPPATASASTASATMPKAMAARVEEHIKQLHDQLGITAAEQPQWDQFAQVMRDNATQISQAFSDRGAKLDTMNAADNMQSYAQLSQVHATNMQKLASAFQSLYNSFPDQQKQTADAVFRANGAKPMSTKKH